MQEEIIEAVRKYSVLYDTNDPEYLKSKLKDEIWNRIAKDLNFKNGHEVKDIWLQLRNCHREALRRQKKCLKSGAAASAIKMWRYQKQMEFLKPYMSNRAREGKLENDSEDENTQEQSENRDITATLDFESENVDTENSDNMLENFRESAENIIETKNSLNNNVETESDIPDKNILEKSQGSSKINKRAVPSTPASSTTALKAKRLKRDDITNLLTESIQQREKRAQERKIERKKLEEMEKPADDVLYHFFMFMYKITKKLPPIYQHTVRSNVFQAVSHAEAEYLQINNNQSQQILLQQTYHQQPKSNNRPHLQHRDYQPTHSWTPQSHSSCSSASDNMSFSPLANLVNNNQSQPRMNFQAFGPSTPQSHSSNSTTPRVSPVDIQPTDYVRDFIQNFSVG